MDAECLEALLTSDAKDQKRGILSVLESYAKGKCTSLHFEHSHSSDVIHSQVKRSNMIPQLNIVRSLRPNRTSVTVR